MQQRGYSMGRTRTFILMAGMTALFAVIGNLIGGQSGMMMALIFAVGTNFFSYWFSDSIVLKMYRAQPIEPNSQPELYHMVERLAKNGGIPTPRLYVMDNPQPNAFATGRSPDKGVVALTTGIMSVLSKDELAGVIAHEMAHIKNRDTLTMTMTSTIAGAISSLANMAMFSNMFGGRSGENRPNPLIMIIVSMVAPMAAMLVQMAISRTREFEADRIGAEICGQPLALASALDKISNGAARIDNVVAEQNPASAHLFIMNPLHIGKLGGLFRTHPATEERIARLQEMAGPKSAAPVQNKSSNPWG
jgi:heat shock protein HtpX